MTDGPLKSTIPRKRQTEAERDRQTDQQTEAERSWANFVAQYGTDIIDAINLSLSINFLHLNPKL